MKIPNQSKITKIAFALILIQSLCCVQSACQSQPIMIESREGQDVHYSLDHYFYNYEQTSISDVVRSTDNQAFHFCQVQQQQNFSMSITQSFNLLESADISKIITRQEVEPVLKKDEIIGTFLDRDNGVIYLLSSNWLKVAKIDGSKIAPNSITARKLSHTVKRGQFLKTNKDEMVYLLTDTNFFGVFYKQKENTLKLNIYQTSTEIAYKNQKYEFVSIFQVHNSLGIDIIGIVTKNSFQFVQINYNPAINGFHEKLITFRRAQGFNNEFLKAYYFDFNSEIYGAKYLLVANKDYFQISLTQQLFPQYFNLNGQYPKNQTLTSYQFFKLPLVLQCTKAEQSLNHLFFQCNDSILYIDERQFYRCKDLSYQRNLIETCIRELKFINLNVGYNIQEISFVELNNPEDVQNSISNKLLILGTDKYEVRNILIATEETRPPHTEIISITPFDTYYPAMNPSQVMMLTSNTFLLVTKTELLTYSHIQQKMQIFCKTADIQSQSAKFDGTLFIRGLCTDMVNQDTAVDVINGELCKIKVPFVVKILPKTNSPLVTVLLYLLKYLIVLILVGGITYFVVKKRRLNQQINLVEQNIQHGGHQALQRTAVTLNNQEEIVANQNNQNNQNNLINQNDENNQINLINQNNQNNGINN